jgi:hypothetical protein
VVSSSISPYLFRLTSFPSLTPSLTAHHPAACYRLFAIGLVTMLSLLRAVARTGAQCHSNIGLATGQHTSRLLLNRVALTRPLFFSSSATLYDRQPKRFVHPHKARMAELRQSRENKKERKARSMSNNRPPALFDSRSILGVEQVRAIHVHHDAPTNKCCMMRACVDQLVRCIHAYERVRY